MKHIYDDDDNNSNDDNVSIVSTVLRSVYFTSLQCYALICINFQQIITCIFNNTFNSNLHLFYLLQSWEKNEVWHLYKFAFFLARTQWLSNNTHFNQLIIQSCYFQQYLIYILNMFNNHFHLSYSCTTWKYSNTTQTFKYLFRQYQFCEITFITHTQSLSLV